MSLDYLTYNKLSSEQFKLHNFLWRGTGENIPLKPPRFGCNSINQFLYHCMSNFCESTTNEMLYKIINKSLYFFLKI